MEVLQLIKLTSLKIMNHIDQGHETNLKYDEDP